MTPRQVTEALGARRTAGQGRQHQPPTTAFVFEGTRASAGALGIHPSGAPDARPCGGCRRIVAAAGPSLWGVGELEETYGSSVHARMASQLGEEPAEPVDDLHRTAKPEEPPVEGAQWDEVHRRWEVWDAATGEWQVVGDAGDTVATADENPLPPHLARDVLLADDLEAEDHPVADVDRASPVGPAPRGAQWNEVTDRWERWDDVTESWVEAPGD